MRCNLLSDSFDFDFGNRNRYREYHSNSSLNYKRKFNVRTSNPDFNLLPGDSVDSFDKCSKDYLVDMLARDLALWLIENEYVKITQVTLERDYCGYMQELEGQVNFKLMEIPRRYSRKVIIEKKMESNIIYTAPEKRYLFIEKYTDYARLLDKRVEWIMKYNNLFDNPKVLQQQYMIQHIVEMDGKLYSVMTHSETKIILSIGIVEMDGMWLNVLTDSETKKILNVSQDYKL